MIRVIVSRGAIDLVAELAPVEAGAGAVATFIGLVRADAHATDAVEMLELEHYPGATEAAIEKLAQQAAERWALTAVTVIHRIGPMRPGERIVLVATAAPHRAAALDACAFLIDRLKTDAPFWKREVRGGETAWVDERGGDHAAAARWD